MLNSLYLKNKTAQNTFILYSSVIINIVLGWVVAKLNTHYLTVSEFGQYTFFISVIYFILYFFTFGIFESNSRLLALQKDENEKQNYFGAAFISSLFLLIPFVLFVLLFSFLSDQIFEVKIGIFLRKNSLLIGFLMVQSYLLLTLRGAGQIKLLSIFTFLPRFFYLIFLVFLIYYGNYILDNTLYLLFTGLIISIIVVLFMIKPKFHGLKQKYVELYNETKRYGIHLYFSNILSETLSHSDKLLISYFLQAESLAYFGLAYMLTYPLSHFSKSLSTALFSKFANENYIHYKILKTNLLYICISVIFFIIFRKFIILYLFSEKYLPAVDLMLPLGMAFGFSGLSKPYTHFLMAKGFGKIVRNISIAVPVSSVLLNIVLIPTFGIYGAAWAAFFSYGLDLALYWYYYTKNKVTLE